MFSFFEKKISPHLGAFYCLIFKKCNCAGNFSKYPKLPFLKIRKNTGTFFSWLDPDPIKNQQHF